MTYRSKPAKKRSGLFLVTVLVLVSAAGGWFLTAYKPASTPAVKASNSSATKSSTKVLGKSTEFNKTQYSQTDPTSEWVIVNKQHALNPKTYTPADLVTPAVPLRVPGNETMQLRAAPAKALEVMFADAKAAGQQLMLSSGYRSYSYQVTLYGGYVKTQGQATADTQSARPGFSEHQTGLAVDIEPVSKTCELEQCFGTTPEGTWAAANAYKYGFIVRYTTGDEDITGYEPEPWHLRYVGIELATELHDTHTATLEQFFDVSGGKTYAQ